MNKQRKETFVNTFATLVMALFTLCLSSCEDLKEFAGVYEGTTVDSLGDEIGDIEVKFNLNLAEDGTFTDTHTIYTEDGEILANVTFKGEWGVKETEYLKSSKMDINGKTIWFKYDVESLQITPEDIASETQEPYRKMLEKENRSLEEYEKEDKVYGWVNVTLNGDSLISARTCELIAVRISNK